MTSKEIRQKYLKFFEKRGHTIIPSASLVPENDASSLFTTAGMQPLVPFLLGEKHPGGNRLVDVQKCIRTGDIEDVGDNRHLTFFEMMGNWSLGDPEKPDGIGAGYFRKESIAWSLEFLTNKDEGLGLDPQLLYVTTFKGELGIPRDEEAILLWQENFATHNIKAEVADTDEVIKDNIRIIPLGTEDNFWIAGATGPCGGDTEIFYDVRPEEGKLSGKFSDLVKVGRLIEIWNNVFMEFNKTADGKYEPLKSKNVDTGMGLERTTVVLNGKANVFETEIFVPLIAEIRKSCLSCHSREGGNPVVDTKAERIIADHIKTAVFMVSDGVAPSNTDRGYVLRRLLRRTTRFGRSLAMDPEVFQTSVINLIKIVISQYGEIYQTLPANEKTITEEILAEIRKFYETLERGLKEFEKIKEVGSEISGLEAFNLFQSYGFPLEITQDLAKEKGLNVNVFEFNAEMKKHQELSRAGADQKFKGGLASTGEMETKYHTATHLLLASLRQVLKGDVVQKGSNITTERLRFDFNWPEKLTPEQIKEIEALVNLKIQEKIPVEMMELPKDEAKKLVSSLSFDLSKYGDIVKVYKIGNFSTEFCGGPHVANTGDLGHFSIVKEEASSAGVRRIKAVLE